MNELQKNWVKALSKIMRNNGCKNEIVTAEDVLSNLFYLSKKKEDGTRFIPLHELRIIEKLVAGLFNSAFEYEDKVDVYCEKVGDTLICYANVRYVQYQADGTKRVLGHGFNAKTLDSVIVPNVFNPSKEQKIAFWKAQTIGGAKSRALFEAGFGIEFYGDPMILAEDDEPTPASAPELASTPAPAPVAEEAKTPEGLPIPTPEPKRRGRPRREDKEKEIEAKTTGYFAEAIKEKKEEETTETVSEAVSAETVEVSPEAPEVPLIIEDMIELTLDEAKDTVADIGTYKGMPLWQILNIAPKNIVFLYNKSESARVKAAAETIINSDEALLKLLA